MLGCGKFLRGVTFEASVVLFVPLDKCAGYHRQTLSTEAWEREEEGGRGGGECRLDSVAIREIIDVVNFRRAGSSIEGLGAWVFKM